MSRSYPIYNKVEACKYKSDKSFGNVDTFHLTQLIGSSSKNSHEFVDLVTTKRLGWNDEYSSNIWVFAFSVDGIILKKAYFEDNNGKPGKKLKIINKMKRIKSL